MFLSLETTTFYKKLEVINTRHANLWYNLACRILDCPKYLGKVICLLIKNFYLLYEGTFCRFFTKSWEICLNTVICIKTLDIKTCYNQIHNCIYRIPPISKIELFLVLFNNFHWLTNNVSKNFILDVARVAL